MESLPQQPSLITRLREQFGGKEKLPSIPFRRLLYRDFGAQEVFSLTIERRSPGYLKELMARVITPIKGRLIHLLKL